MQFIVVLDANGFVCDTEATQLELRSHMAVAYSEIFSLVAFTEHTSI